MKTITKISATILYTAVAIGSVIQGDPWKTVGYFVIGVFIGLSLLMVWNKRITIEDKE